MNKLNCAIIGCGRIFSTHADAILKCTDANLYAVCDSDKERAEKAAKKYQCKAFYDYKDLLNDKLIDVVHICTPNYLHAAMAIDAMQHGKHVFTEKPMAITVSEAQKMIEVSEDTGKLLGVCFQNRYNTTSIKVKELLTSGKVGKVLGGRAFMTWNRDREYYASDAWRGTWDQEGGGALINQAIHTLDLIQWFIGDVEKVTGSIHTRLLKDDIEVEDTAEATILFKDGTVFLFYASNNYCMDAPVSIEIVCENAVIRMDEELTVRYGNGDVETFIDIDSSTGEKSYWGNSHKELIEDFYHSIINSDRVRINGEQGIISLKMINAVYEESALYEVKQIG
jgi:predicted dehydrogenase